MDLLQQFAIKTYIPIHIFGVDISFTNASFFMIMAVSSFCIFSSWSIKNHALVPTVKQSIVEMIYQFLTTTVESFSGKEGLKYFPYLFGLFVFIFLSNLFGVIPGFFTTTSQIIVTFSLAFTVFLSVTIIGIVKHGFGFLRLFLPKNIPWYVAIILVPVEIISYLSRPISLSVRLFANMIAGHVLLKVFATFAALCIGNIFFPISIIPILLNVIFIFFELVISFLQAYVFTILSCIYLKDALHLH